jgi:hypothetical protein
MDSVETSFTPELTSHEQGLANLLASVWSGKFHVTYRMPAERGPVAAPWVDYQRQQGRSITEWSCKNLEEAAEQYAWDSRKDANKANNYWNCRQKLLEALWSGRSNAATRESCLQIFKWGGVARKKVDISKQWVDHHLAAGTIVSELQQAIQVLKGEVDPQKYFGRNKLLMNSAMTKVYAIGDPEERLPIFDGRVGAALGILAVRYCRERGLRIVPDELAFGFFDSQDSKKRNSRNPSRGSLKFRALGDDRFHASCMWRCTKILGAARRIIGGSSTILKLERALFMIGYDVRSFQ